MSKDPILFAGGINLFGYVEMTPQNLRDASGLKCSGSPCPNYPPGCGEKPTPQFKRRCGDCNIGNIMRQLASARRQLALLQAGEGLEVTPGGGVSGHTACYPVPLGDGWWATSRCDWPPYLKCSGDPCVDYCTCRHEWVHFKDKRPFRMEWSDLELLRHWEIPAYEEEVRCLSSYL